MSVPRDAKEVLDKQNIELYNKFQRLLLLKDHYFGPATEQTPPKNEIRAEKRSYSVSGKKPKFSDVNSSNNKKEKEDNLVKNQRSRGDSINNRIRGDSVNKNDNANQKSKETKFAIKENKTAKGDAAVGVVKKSYIKERSFRSDLVLKPPRKVDEQPTEDFKPAEIEEPNEAPIEDYPKELINSQVNEEEQEKAKETEEKEKFAIIERGRKNYRIEPILNERKKKKSVGKQEAVLNKNQPEFSKEQGKREQRDFNDDKELEEYIRRKYTQKEFDEDEFEELKEKLINFKKSLNSKLFLGLKNLIKPSENVQRICRCLLILFNENIGLDHRQISDWKYIQSILDSERFLHQVHEFSGLVEKGHINESDIMNCAISLEKISAYKGAYNEASFLIPIITNLLEFLHSACDYYFTCFSLKDSKHQNFLLTNKLPSPYPSEIQQYKLDQNYENKENEGCFYEQTKRSHDEHKTYSQKDDDKRSSTRTFDRSNRDRSDRSSRKENRSRNSSASSEVGDRRSTSSKRSSNNRQSSGKLSKLDRIMKLKVEKPEKESVIKKYVEESVSAKDLKKTKLFSDETLMIQEEIDKTNKEMKEMEGKKLKLLSIYERERMHQQKLEEMKRTKQEIEDEFQKNKRLEEIQSLKEKEERKFLEEIKQNNIEDVRKRKRKLTEQKKEREDDDLRNSKNESLWKEKIKKAEIKAKKQSEKDLNESMISFKQAVQKQKEELKLKEIDDINRRKEDSLKYKQKEAITKKEELEKQLEKTLDFINSLRMSKLN